LSCHVRFQRPRVPTDIILICVRWYCKYGISYRDLEEMMSERGVTVDYTTLFRWVQHYAPLMPRMMVPAGQPTTEARS
jgi:transposase, IS6 family